MSDKVINQIDTIEKNVMSGLKDFQKATVERIDHLFRNAQMRVLVSDEVGLGKTLIARGTIAKFAKLQKEKGDTLVKVVYICSNTAIADQNLKKLKITKDLKSETADSSRLSMQHLNIFNQENDTALLNGYIQLIPLTPDTSFRMTSGAGTYNERALMFALLKRMPQLFPYERNLEIAMKDSASSSWRWAKDNYETKVINCDNNSGGKYIRYMLDKLSDELNKTAVDNKTYLDLIIDTCENTTFYGNKKQNNYVISKLRSIFAQISLEKLEPDLVIMDEFQRFKYLIQDKESDTGMLANKFFNSNRVRMLLLSATPYKMYSTLEEIDELEKTDQSQSDEHYSEFFDVMNFLNITEKEKDEFKTVWKNYSVHLKELTDGDTTILVAKNKAEEALYKHICRTERLSASENADIIDDTDVKIPLKVTEQDVKSYLQAQKLLEEIGLAFNVPIDYVKSSPYLMSFMWNYKFKQQIEKYFFDHPDEIKKINKDTLWIKRKVLDNYEKIPCNNARLERVMTHVFKDNAELLLWVPPSKPYYSPQGVYKNTENFSKTLVFSSWEMVPRMLSMMLSYEAERKTAGKLAKAKGSRYFQDDKKRYPSGRLKFALDKEKQPKSMALFCLMYPSQFLSECYDPIYYVNSDASLNKIETEIKNKIAMKLDKYMPPENEKSDERWYYLAPLLLDGAGYVTTWLESGNNLVSIDDEENANKKSFTSHLKLLKELYAECDYGRKCPLGKKPDDLLDILADIAIASPAVAINRTYKSYQKSGTSFPSYLPTQIAKIFINRMNTPESTATVELACGIKSDDAHWQNVLTYCKHGNIQSMFDEYAHLITNGLDYDQSLIKNLHQSIAESITLRTTVYKIDTYNGFKARINGVKETPTMIRSHFAVAFTKGEGTDKSADRKKNVRNAFNSPFRPFVLASTSIGQEGLDFHNYCRRIVHWNLPSNPIDLEQREGRINRFECLAIRQNISKRYGSVQFKKNTWNEMFDVASKLENNGQGSDLIPFWGLTERKDMVKIERIVPMYPFSRDGLVYDRLMKILNLYRLTLGQPRQEELLEYIFQNCKNVDDMKKLFINLSPYYKNTKE